MAEGGYDPEKIDTKGLREALGEIERGSSETIKNRAYEEEDVSFNTSTESGLSTNDSFLAGRPPPSELVERELIINSMEDWLDNALKSDHRVWKGATKTGKRLLAARLYKNSANGTVPAWKMLLPA